MSSHRLFDGVHEVAFCICADDGLLVIPVAVEDKGGWNRIDWRNDRVCFGNALGMQR